MKLKKGSIALLTLAGMFYMSVQKSGCMHACRLYRTGQYGSNRTYNGLERRYYE